MPILYNFHILLASFHTIFGTNLIECPVPVPVCCMFFVSHKIHIKRSPNGIKTNGEFFGIYVIFGKKDQRKTMLEGATRRGRTLGPHGHRVRRLVPFFLHKKANIRIEIMLKFQPNRSYGLSWYSHGWCETTYATRWLRVRVRLLPEYPGTGKRVSRASLPRFAALRRDNTPTPACLSICGISIVQSAPRAVSRWVLYATSLMYVYVAGMSKHALVTEWVCAHMCVWGRVDG